jgi:hypothetical protein
VSPTPGPDGFPVADDPIEDYLDALLLSLRGSPREIRHTIAEVEAHLYDSVDALIAGGAPRPIAQAEAIRQLGPASGIAAAPRLRDRLTTARVRRLVLGLLVVGGVGGLAVAVGGALAWVVRAVWGNRAIATPFPSGTYSAADCARWLAGYPSTHSCTAAMTADHAQDFLLVTWACGVLGVAAIGLFVMLRRRWSSLALAAALPRAAEDVAGAVLALIATVALIGRGLDAALVLHGASVGQSLSLAVAAAAATIYFGIRAAHSRPPAGHRAAVG